VNRVARVRAKGITTSLSLSLSIYISSSFSFALRYIVCNYSLLSPLSFSLSLSFHSCLSLRSFAAPLSSPLSLFSLGVFARAGDRVARPVRHGFSSRLFPSFSPPECIVQCATFTFRVLSCGATVRESGAWRVREGTRDRSAGSTIGFA